MARRSRQGGWGAAALLGGAGLAVGAFAPAVVVDYWGPVSLFDVAELQAVLVAAAGALGAAAPLAGRRAWAVLAALLAWLGVTLPLVRNALAPEEDGVLEQLGRALGDSVGRTVADAFGDVALEMTAPAWGLAPLLGGLALLSWAALRAAR